jgi:uncharacterized membrane protein YeaQ/YmgE (transglycosylase-associated protein family)
MGIISWIVIGLLAGWATGKIMKGAGYGFWADMLLGLCGSLAGRFVFGLLGLSRYGGFIYSLIVAIIGSVILVFLFRLITGKR